MRAFNKEPCDGNKRYFEQSRWESKTMAYSRSKKKSTVKAAGNICLFAWTLMSRLRFSVQVKEKSFCICHSAISRSKTVFRQYSHTVCRLYLAICGPFFMYKKKIVLPENNGFQEICSIFSITKMNSLCALLLLPHDSFVAYHFSPQVEIIIVYFYDYCWTSRIWHTEEHRETLSTNYGGARKGEKHIHARCLSSSGLMWETKHVCMCMYA